ncbi:MAG TPA: Lrp/AsnC ligand binding domain-containing protein [Dehalococcoidia bacterium]|nr:Lrp/AsnC ligand binding domain-containing protein [Dehalococcoidia bacterium]HLB29596.1 Lrp/AsnC ligand binding domain-containing protein [Dehalococcoidia bacterium]
MAVRSYVLIEATVGKARSIGEALLKLNHPNAQVLSVDTVTGPYDLIVQLETDDLDKLGIFITEEIQRIEGVQRTTTCLSVRLS